MERCERVDCGFEVVSDCSGLFITPARELARRRYAVGGSCAVEAPSSDTVRGWEGGRQNLGDI